MLRAQRRHFRAGFTGDSAVVGVGAWAPTDLGSALKAWWNADDHGTANMTDDGSGVISAWKDRIGGMSVTAATTARPTWTANAFNSTYAGLTFDGTNHAMVSTSLGTLPTGSTAGEIWVLASNGGDATIRIVLDYGDGGSATTRRVQKDTSNRLRIGDGSTNLTDATATSAGVHIWSGNWSGTVMGGRIDGRLPSTPTATIASLNTATTRLRIASQAAAGAGARWLGVVRHAMITTTLTATQKEQLEGWLFWEVGLQSQLPSTHSYRSGPP